jgi:hypothetical protein
VIDPTVFRVADVFARGRSGAESDPTSDPTSAWKLIRDNLVEVAAFVDAVVLEPGLVVPDYGESFGSPFPWAEEVQGQQDPRGDLPPLFDIVNLKHHAPHPPLLAPIKVRGAVWWPLAGKLFGQLKEATPLPEEVTAGLARRLDSMQWRFGEKLLLAEPQWPLSPNIRVNGFLYVTLLFGRYAEKMGGTQLLSPAATSALLTAELSEDTLSDADLFTTLEQVYDSVPGAEKRTLRVARPSFLPYLLEDEKIQTPADLLQKAVAEREKPEVREYRGWLAGIQARIDSAGRMPLDAKKQLTDLVAHIEWRYAANAPLTFDVGVQLWPPAPTISKKVDATGPRDWWLRTMPGSRYRRMLLKLTLATAETVRIETPLRGLWNRA